MASPGLLRLASPDPNALLQRVVDELRALEEACADAERIVQQCAWDQLEESIRNQRRLTHALANAMDASSAVRSLEFDEKVRNRLRFIGLTRDRHITQLQKAQTEIGARLNTLTSWKRAARKWLTGYTPTRRSAGLDQRR